MSNHLPGNPHETDYRTSEGDVAAATMALAFEQRTANMIAVLTSGFTTVQVAGIDYETLANQIVARLQPVKQGV